MQRATARFAKNDLAKYPFLKETTEYVRKLDFRIEDLENPEFAKVLQRAQERLEEAILYTRVSRKLREEDIEILSFPVTIMLTIATENSFIKKRYALAEAKQAFEDLKLEPKEKLRTITQNFAWKLAPIENPEPPFEFTLNFVDYLRNTTNLHEKKWKLVNRLLSNGNVYLSRNETARLLSEEVRRYIEKRQETMGTPKLPPKIMEIAEQTKKFSKEKIGETEMEGFPKTVVQEAFPPCIQALYQSFTSGRHLSHIGRFTLTSFLINIGMPSETVIELFKSFSDFNERMTRYQVEHIAGTKGSRTMYIPPKCDTLKTHGVCTNPNESCKRIYHPLGYYRRKTRKTDRSNLVKTG
ncbi:MAG TPA: DNA primase large subunit PriL [Candidatus Bathyarchaeia archaeon]|nr:DNA primase large subunit PriL [Candidatus Bathyarchaeia archaeon]